MSIADWKFGSPGTGTDKTPVPDTTETRPLHRIREIRQQQGVTLRTAARRMNVSMEQARKEERLEANMTLSDLYRWQRALEVPVADLLVDLDAPLSPPVMQRAKMLRIMKTVQALLQSTEDESVQRMASMLADQVTDIMPELKDVGAWHSVGQRRTLDEVGRIVERSYSDRVFSDYD